MSNDRVSLRSVPRAVVGEIREEDVPFMAGSIAYQAFVSLIPLLILAFVLVVLIAAVVAAVVAGTAIAALNVPFVDVVSTLALLVVLTGAFVPMYYLFPDTDLPMRHVLPGAVFAAVGWTALQALFSVYVAVSGKADAYGVLGAVLLLVTWLYFSGLVLLVGATLNAVLAGRAGQGVVEDEGPDSSFDSLPDLDSEGESPALAADRTAARIEGAKSRRKRRELARENADLRSERDRLRRQNARLRNELGYRRQPTWTRLYRRLRGD